MIRCFCLVLACALASSAVIAAPPAWWGQGRVLNNNPANDYTALNQGQLKNLAKQAAAEFNARIPGGAGREINDLVSTWTPVPATGSNYNAVNQGQLKELGRIFYDRLIDVGYWKGAYPWTAVEDDDDSFSIANIGMAKQMFNLDITEFTEIPTVPVGVTAVVGDMQVRLTWTSDYHNITYRILRSTTNGSGYVNFAGNTSSTNEFTDYGLTNGVTYYYVVLAENAIGASAYSSQVSVIPSRTTTPGNPTTPPQDPPPVGPPPTTPPPGPDSRYLSDILDFHSALFAGRYEQTIPIVVPPARGGSAPVLSLTYSSARGNKFCGVGWSFEPSYIVRETRGTNLISGTSYNDNDGFCFSSSGHLSRLTRIGTSSDYRLNIDYGDFLLFRFSGGTWTLINRNGDHYTFGTNSESRIVNNGLVSNRTYRWNWDGTVDINGNTTVCSYLRDAEQLYPQSITYNANANDTSLAANLRVYLEWEDRPPFNGSAETTVDNTGAFALKTNKRLKTLRTQILNSGNWSPIRRYELGYLPRTTPESLLKTIQVFGNDDASSLPSTGYSYTASNFLNTVDNGQGAVTTISYVTQAVANTSTPVNAVQAITQTDGMGNTIPSVRYAYAGGSYETATKEFRGFNKVSVTNAIGVGTITYFHQGNSTTDSNNGEWIDSIGKQGTVYKTEIYGNDGLKYSDSFNKIEALTPLASTPNWHFLSTTKSISRDFEGLANSKDTAIESFPNVSTGNIEKVKSYGEVASFNASTYSFTDVDSRDTVATITIFNQVFSNPEISPKIGLSGLTPADTFGLTDIQNQLQYDMRGNLTKDFAWLDKNNDGVLNQWILQNETKYDIRGNPSSQINALGIEASILYDATQTLPTQTTTAGSFVTKSDYDLRSGAIKNTTDVKGLVSYLEYDVFFRPTASYVSSVPNGPQALWKNRMGYSNGNTAGSRYQRLRVNDGVDGTNGTEKYIYSDGLGRTIHTRVESEMAGQCRVTDNVYSSSGLLSSSSKPYFSSGYTYTAPSGAALKSSYYYDALGRVRQINLPVGEADSPTGNVQTGYSDGSNPWCVVSTNARGKKTTSYSDAFGQTTLVKEQLGSGFVNTTTAYDRYGRVTSITDHNSNSTFYIYDTLSRRLGTTDPNIGTENYSYDNANRVVTKQDSKNQKTYFWYNEPTLKRLSSVQVKTAANKLDSSMEYRYDSFPGYTVYKGQLARTVENEQTENFSYDLYGNTKARATKIGKSGQTYTLAFDYDDADQLTQINYPSGGRVNYMFTADGKLSKLEGTNGFGGATQRLYDVVAFDNMGHPTSYNLTGGMSVQQVYYPGSGRLKDKTLKKGASPLDSLAYKYDANGNPTYFTDNYPANTSFDTAYSGLGYDDLDRLNDITADSRDNITGITGSTYGYQGTGPNWLTSFNSVSYDYDAAGAPKNYVIKYPSGGPYATKSITYNASQQVKSLGTSYSTTSTFGYSQSGKRLWKYATTPPTNGSAALKQYYVGDLYQETRVKATDGSETITKTCFIPLDGGRLASFEPVSSGTPKVNYYFTDNVNRNRMEVDYNGSVTQRFKYTFLGVMSNLLPTSFAQNFNPNLSFDDESGLYLYGSRYYDPKVGRFLQPDSTFPSTSGMHGLNRYSYASNNPLRYNDPTGHGVNGGDGIEGQGVNLSQFSIGQDLKGQILDAYDSGGAKGGIKVSFTDSGRITGAALSPTGNFSGFFSGTLIVSNYYVGSIVGNSLSFETTYPDIHPSPFLQVARQLDVNGIPALGGAMEAGISELTTQGLISYAGAKLFSAAADIPIVRNLLSAVGSKIGGLFAAKGTETLMQNGAKYVLPADRAAVNAFNKAALADFRASGGKISNLSEPQAFFGRYGSKDNVIELAPGRNLDTLTEELIHFRQAQELGVSGKAPFPGGPGSYEADAVDRLLELGFTR